MELNFLFQEQFETIREEKEEQCLDRGYSKDEAQLYAEAFAEGCIETHIEVVLSLLNEHNISLPLAMEKLKINEDFLKLLLEYCLDERYRKLPKAKNITMCDIYNKIEGRGIQKGIQMQKENTETERTRADSEKKRADKIEKENERLKKLLAKNNISY